MKGADSPGLHRAFTGIVFDLDGTLVDSYRAIQAAVNAARRRWNLAPLDEATVRRHVGRGLEALLADLIGADRVSEAVERFREHYARVYREDTRWIEGAEATVRRLHHSGYRLAVASNKPSRFGRAILRHLGAEDCFTCILGPEDVGTVKPHPAMLREAMRRLGTTPDRTLYVGDMPLDAQTAANAGAPLVLVATGSASRDELEATGHPVLEGLDELAGWLEQGRFGDGSTASDCGARSAAGTRGGEVR